MENDVYHVFTHKDLDGAISLLTFIWSNPNAHVTYREVTNTETDLIKEYVLRTCNPPKIKIFDLSLREEFIPELDYDYIEFIDHHERSKEHIKNFKQAKILWENTTSNAMLIRKTYKSMAPELTDAQKKLILFADDHDSGEYKYPESYNLNILFWTQFKNQFCYFCDYYKNGFVQFSPTQLEIIQKSKDYAKKKVKETQCFGGKLVIDGEPQNVIAAMTDGFNNLVIDMLMAKYKPDIFLYINTRTERVSMRQTKKENPINLAAFAEKYCEGNGNTYTAGGNVTPYFLELTKKFTPL